MLNPKKEIDELYQDHDWADYPWEDDFDDIYDDRDWYLPEEEDDDYDDEEPE